MSKSRTGGSTTRQASPAGSASRESKVSGRQQSLGAKGTASPSSASDTRKSRGTAKNSDDMSLKRIDAIKRLPNGDVKELILAAIDAGVRYRATTKGIMFYGENGESTTIHTSVSDRRGAKNVAANLRRIGFDPGRK